MLRNNFMTCMMIATLAACDATQPDTESMDVDGLSTSNDAAFDAAEIEPTHRFFDGSDAKDYHCDRRGDRMSCEGDGSAFACVCDEDACACKDAAGFVFTIHGDESGAAPRRKIGDFKICCDLNKPIGEPCTKWCTPPVGGGSECTPCLFGCDSDGKCN